MGEGDFSDAIKLLDNFSAANQLKNKANSDNEDSNDSNEISEGVDDDESEGNSGSGKKKKVQPPLPPGKVTDNLDSSLEKVFLYLK